MPKAPPKAIRHTQAPQPQRQSWATSKGKRLTGYTNQKARWALFKKEPLCRSCSAAGRVSVASIRDHVVPLAFGGLEHPSNEQPLCKECHDIKSKAEAIEGARRGRGGAFKG
jgi:5-methylcytosine-specific restriction protein A